MNKFFNNLSIVILLGSSIFLSACNDGDHTQSDIPQLIETSLSPDKIAARPSSDPVVVNPSLPIEIVQNESEPELSRCTNEQAPPISYHQLEIMSYNVENLFDTLKDEGRNDWTFTPGAPEFKEYDCMLANPKGGYYLYECLNTDWTETHLDRKLSQIAKVIHEGRTNLPDILALVEVENGRGKVIEKLAQKLGYENYQIATTDDGRGIATAVLYNRSNPKFDPSFEFIFSEIKHPNPKMKTRRVLEVQFSPVTITNGSTEQNIVSLFINHWPSQGSPTKERLAIAQEVMKVVNTRLDSNPNHHVILTGDFNVIDSEFPHPINSVVLNGNEVIDQSGRVVKNNNLIDVYPMLPYEKQNALPSGSYFYHNFGAMEWNHLDRFIVSQNLINKSFSQDITSGLSIYKSSFEFFAPCFITETYKYTDINYPNYGSVVLGAPKGYDPTLDHDSPDQGFSDHLPIVIRLKL